MMNKESNTKRYGMLTLVGAMMLCAGTVHAAPEDGEVIEGEADIDYGDWTRVVTGEITIIEWLSFNIAAGETVEFIMPSETSRVLNLINSGVPTEIMGNLLANGQVFLVNPSGVIFGQGSVVNVGALYAAAGNISNSDFMSGVYRFTDARGVVENRGLLMGDMIALVGGRVANHGTISAPGGTVVMAAGEQVLIGEHLGHVFVQLEKPTDLDNADQLGDPGFEGVDLAAGDVYSLAAWNTGEIVADQTTIAVSAGHMVIDHDLTAGELTLTAENDSYIELGADLASDGDEAGSGVFVDGDVVLTSDVGVDLLAGDGEIYFGGSVDSAAGMEHDLIVDAGVGHVRFDGSVGTGFDGARLGVLDVAARNVLVGGDVAVNQEMNFYAPVGITGDSTTFDVGMGTALFADRLYSQTDGQSDVAFEYDGQAWVGTGEARTPFQFRAGIGVGTLLSQNPAEGAFRNIYFGGDLADPSRASAFLFGTGAMAGLELMHEGDVDLGYHFAVNARESIVMGQGQKITSFGSLSLSAKGAGETLIEIGDLNVLGDLRVISQGQQGGLIRILDRAPGEVDWAGNEADRDLPGLMDSGTELIASGNITLDGDLAFGGPVLLGGSSVSLYNNSGMGDAGTLEIGVFPGGVSLELFAGMLSGTGGLLYPYDLAVLSIDDSQAELATALTDEGPVDLRSDDPLLADRQVLAELGMNPHDPDPATIRRSLGEQARTYDENGAEAFGVTIDRLTPASVERLTGAYVGLLGPRVEHDAAARADEEAVREAIGRLWLQSGGESVDIAEFARERDERGYAVVMEIESVLEAIGLLELTPLEIARAKVALLNRIRPEGVPLEGLLQWFGVPEVSIAVR